jgi:hypothetical protein
MQVTHGSDLRKRAAGSVQAESKVRIVRCAKVDVP